MGVSIAKVMGDIEVKIKMSASYWKHKYRKVSYFFNADRLEKDFQSAPRIRDIRSETRIKLMQKGVFESYRKWCVASLSSEVEYHELWQEREFGELKNALDPILTDASTLLPLGWEIKIVSSLPIGFDSNMAKNYKWTYLLRRFINSFDTEVMIILPNIEEQDCHGDITSIKIAGKKSSVKIKNITINALNQESYINAFTKTLSIAIVTILSIVYSSVLEQVFSSIDTRNNAVKNIINNNSNSGNSRKPSSISPGAQNSNSWV